MTLTKLIEKLELKIVTGSINEDSFDGVYAGDFLSRAMSHVEAGNLWITIMSNANVVAVASLTECAAVILAEGVELLPDALSAAQENGILFLSSDLTVYELCVKIGEIINE